MSSNVAADSLLPQSLATASSVDSGQGSEPLSDAFVAVPAARRSRKAAANRVVAPEGSSLMQVRHSS